MAGTSGRADLLNVVEYEVSDFVGLAETRARGAITVAGRLALRTFYKPETQLRSPTLSIRSTTYRGD
jgi:hypothetical protein